MTSLLRPVSLLALAANAPAHAQIAEDTAQEDIVVTAQRGNETQVARAGQVGVLGDKPAEDVPFTIRSYNAALILNQQPQTLGQVLENDPSIRTTYGFGNASEQFVIRGFQLYGDDVGLNGLYGITPRQLVAPELYDQVQILNGASAFLNGAAPGGSGIGGSVNVVAKRAGAAPLTRATANYTAEGHLGGSLDLSRRSADGRWGVRINGAYRTGDVSIDDEFRRAAVVGGALEYRRSAFRFALDLAYQNVEVRRLRPKVTIATATVPAVPAASANYAQPWTYTRLRDLFGSARVEWDVAPNAMLYAVAGARDGRERGFYGGITVTDAASGAATGNALFVPRTDNNEAAQAGLRVRLASGGVSQEVNIGSSFVWQANRNAYDFRYGPNFAGYPTNLYATPVVAIPGSTLTGGNLDDPFPIARTRLASFYASDTVGVLGDRVLLTGGLRLQRITVRSYSYADGTPAGAYDKDAATPVIGLIIKPAAGLSLYANRIEGLSQGPTAPLDATLINSGEVLPPFRSVQYEVGGKLVLGRVNLSLAAFRITLPTAYTVLAPGGTGLLRYGFNGEQRNQGLEFSIDGELARGLRLIAGASVIDATLTRTAGGVNQGNTVTGVPDYLANANVEWDLPFAPRLTLTGRVVATGEQQVNLANTLTLPVWTRFDLGARYIALLAGRPVTLRVNVDNVANSRFWASAYDVFSQALLQGAPRTAKASMTVDF